MSANVLIVEDEIVVATDLVAILEDLGYTAVGIAPDTQAALDLAAKTKPDLALVDLNLRDGATGRDIGAMLSARDIGVVFLTANPRSLQGGVPGALGCLCKPCDEDCIDAALAYALSRRRGENAIPPASLSVFDQPAT